MQCCKQSSRPCQRAILHAGAKPLHRGTSQTAATRGAAAAPATQSAVLHLPHNPRCCSCHTIHGAATAPATQAFLVASSLWPLTPPLLPALPPGETISECAVREVMEETGVTILNQPDPSSEGISSRLSYPTPFAAVDSIVRNDQGGYKYHYAVIDVGGCAGR